MQASDDVTITAEQEMRREQLRLIAVTSLPGIVFGSLGSGLVWCWAQYWTDSPATRSTLLGVAVVSLTVVAVWGVALWACRRDDLRTAFAAQFAANALCAVLFLLFVEDGAVLALSAAFVGVFAGATSLDEAGQRTGAFIMTLAVLLAGAAHETGVVNAIELPPAVFYTATIIGIVFVFRTPLSALRMFNRNVTASRQEAIQSAQIASDERDRADEKARDLSKATEELRALNYFVSHDLRAPLINIEGFANVLEETLAELDEQLRQPGGDADALLAAWEASHAEIVESLHFISGGTVKLNSLVTGLLELSRIDSRPQEDVSIPLEPLLESIADSLEHQIRESRITLDIGSLPTVVGDPLRIGQVFGNLIDNAIKYMPEREPREIRVSCEEAGDHFVFSVTDSGAGIAPEQRSSVFRPFHRLDAKGSPAGEGLGLAAVRKIVERHGGRIWVEDAPTGPGASFRFTLPRRPLLEDDQVTTRNAA